MGRDGCAAASWRRTLVREGRRDPRRAGRVDPVLRLQKRARLLAVRLRPGLLTLSDTQNDTVYFSI